MEPERNLAGTAVLVLYKKRDHFIGAGASGPTLLRRSTRIMDQNFDMVREAEKPTKEPKCKTMYMLSKHLEEEERADRYSPAIGFSS